MANPTTRPKFLNLLQIRFPVTAVVSILHRVSGVLMVLTLPLVIYLFGLSLQDQAGFERVQNWLALPWVRLISLLFVWAFAHHGFAGVRFLLLDLEIGISRRRARLGAWLVFVASLISLVVYAWFLYGGAP